MTEETRICLDCGTKWPDDGSGDDKCPNCGGNNTEIMEPGAEYDDEDDELIAA